MTHCGRIYRRGFLPRAALGLLLLSSLGGAALAETPEPQDYWTGALHAPTPKTLSGARVISTDELAALIDAGDLLLLDVAMPDNRPDKLPEDAIWKPLEHRDIKGSVWLPGAGAGRLDPKRSDIFRDKLAALSSGDYDRRIVFYCHTDCWASWNAAKRAMSFGYHNILWYRDGVEGWQDSGRPLAPSGEAQAPLL